MPTGDSENVLLTLNEMKWVAGPPTLPVGVKIMVIEGNPREAGPFTMALVPRWDPRGAPFPPWCRTRHRHFGLRALGNGRENLSPISCGPCPPGASS
jgi:hypothetical protein